MNTDRVGELTARELRKFRDDHPVSEALSERARGALLGGVPMNWMNKWATAFPIDGEPGAFPQFATRAEGARLYDVDGREYVDLCLGDTGAMTGHAPPQVVAALREQLGRGLTYMLPTESAIEAAELLGERFGLPEWQFTVSATDANRFAIRLARAVTGRPKVLVFDHCYHGTVDEAFATLGADGEVTARRFNLGPPVPLAETTRVVEFNDLAGLERELAHGDVACVLTEPALTNVGVVLPQPGFHDGLRELTRRHGTLLILDETHTLSAGPAGLTGIEGLSPDLLTLGKAIASGIPAGAYGIGAELAERIRSDDALRHTLVEGIGSGGTLAGNALTMTAIAVTLREVLTPVAYRHMVALATRWADGVRTEIDRHGLEWHVTQVGARAEYHFTSEAPTTGAQLAAVGDEPLERLLRLHMVNRGVVTTPFHNMALMCPATSEADVDLHSSVLAEILAELHT